MSVIRSNLAHMLIPAFKINESTLPKAETDSFSMFLQESRFVMSVLTAIELPPSLFIWLDNWLSLLIFLDANTTLEVFANLIDSDFPIPEEAPVMI